MRLELIKLSGFKSFAEPVQLPLRTQLVGVVGPNGCGKSNIMDAVRWVLGESKASQLRGESMQDVIFGGTNERRPASRASVELVFDNSEQRAGGQWNQFTQIAVKRVLTRQGGSTYFINNQAVRRRDVHDVFLGTGLGPRAYAIIGQGTISRIIESRPEELRLFLEEAAGVSKYKERRRETQNRLRGTEENLYRVQDVLHELDTQLEKLRQQSQLAQQHRDLSASAALKQQQLWLLRHQSAQSDLEQVRLQGLEAMTALEAKSAQITALELSIEQQRQAHISANDELSSAQDLLYQARTEASKLEAQLRYTEQSHQRLEQRLEHIRQQRELWQQRQLEAQAHLEDIDWNAEEAAQAAELACAQLEDHAANTMSLEEALDRAQHEAQTYQRQIAALEQQIKMVFAQRRSLEQQLEQIQQSETHLQDRENTKRAQTEAQTSAQQAKAAADHLQTQSIPALEQARREYQQRLNASIAEYEKLTAQQQALQALQTLSDEESTARLQSWLQEQGFSSLLNVTLDAAQVWEQINVQAGWENAVQAALGQRIFALSGNLEITTQLINLIELINQPPPQSLVFYGFSGSSSDASSSSSSDGLSKQDSLARKIQTSNPALRCALEHWLHGCRYAPSLSAALEQQSTLEQGQYIYTPEGHALSAISLEFYAHHSQSSDQNNNPNNNLLARAKTIENLSAQICDHSVQLETARADLHRTESELENAAINLAQEQRRAQTASDQAHQLQMRLIQLEHLSDLAQQQRQKSDQCQEQCQELEFALEALQEQARHSEDNLHTAQTRLEQHRQQLRSLERQAQESAFAQRSLEARRSESQRSLETAYEQLQELEKSESTARAEYESMDSHHEVHEQLQAALLIQSQHEQRLSQQRLLCQNLAHELEQLQTQHRQLQQELEPLRQRITEFQLQEQAASLTSDQYAQQLQEAGADLEAIAQSIIQDGVRLHGLQGEIERLQRQIASLGSVNLAALEELEIEQKRQEFLSAQLHDLTEAMHTLESAIKQIDAQTRQLLLGTFNTVNDHFGRMFPELFGGGQARLIMTGEEVLEAGVQVMAQPPGKKNQTIHLLSGGEKALTAVALVFAIFQLNPAPFCLLDEVDAPLDDSNTERYAKLLESMSEQTQFLFISHNKIAMQQAHQLVGVTMQEQGVSRIVTVDMQEALRWSAV